MYVLDDLVTGARAYLAAGGYSDSTVRHYDTAWRRLAEWCAENAREGYDRDAESRYLAHASLTGPSCTKQQRFERRAVERLIEIAETGAPAKPRARRTYAVPEGMMPAYELYAEELTRRGLKASTIGSYLSTVRHFLATCGADDPSGLCPQSVTAFSSSTAGFSPQTRAGKLYVVRDLARTLSDRGMCGPSLAASLPLIPGHKHSSVPSAWSAEEVTAVLAGTPSGRCPLRTRAILLLASVLGMRACDIRALRMSDVDWRLKTVSFTQSKTQVPQVLPMPEEVWLALADYIKNERPEADGDTVFVTALAPHRPVGSREAFHRSVSRELEAAGADVSRGRHGIHSLRHSAATNMLADGTPYPTISAVLGHSSTAVTMRYLSIDVESLRDIALEVPRCR